MSGLRFTPCLLAMAGTFLLGQESFVEVSAGVASAASDLSRYARPGALVELHLGDPLADQRWGARARLQLARYQEQQVTVPSGPDTLTYRRQASSFTTSFEFFPPAGTSGSVRLRGLFGFGLDVWKLSETQTSHAASGTGPDRVTDNGYGLYFGYDLVAGLRMEFARQAHAELRLEASRVNFVGAFKDPEFNAPVRVTATAGWRF